MLNSYCFVFSKVAIHDTVLFFWFFASLWSIIIWIFAYIWAIPFVPEILIGLIGLLILFGIGEAF